MHTKRRKKQYDRFNIWRSYSDMMSGLLLLFILVMCVSFMQAQKNYQERVMEQAEHQQTQDQLTAELEERENQLAEQQAALDEQSALLQSQQEDLDEKNTLLAEQQATLDEKNALLTSQQEELDEQSALLQSQQEDLAEQQALVQSQQATLEEQEELMEAQQQKLEQIIGIKADLITALKEEFASSELSVTIDESDGSIALDSSVLFGYNETELTAEGQEMLSQVLPIYCSVLLDEEYQDYLAEIRIDGYTDTDGDYLYNLQLSQERALAVSNALIEWAESSLTEDQLDYLKEKLTANGHSMSDPVYDESGAIDKDASRRVEIKFSLKDEEMINEMKQILDDM